MKVKRLIISVLMVCVVFSAFGAGAKEEKAESGKPIEISFLNFYVRGTDAVAAGADPRIEQFRADYPEIILKEESLGFSDALTKLKSLGAANDLPDMFIPNIPMAKEWAAAGLLHPLNDILDTDSVWKNGFMAGSLEEFNFDGTTYGIPPWKNIHGIVFYNESIFAECGIDSFPADWDEFIDAVKVIKAHGYLPWTSYGKKSLGFSSILSVLNYGQFGTGWFEGVLASDNKFTDAEFIQSLNRFKQLVDIGAFNDDMYSMDQTQSRSAYLIGQAAMTVDGTWAVGLINENAEKAVLDNTVITFLPGEAGKPILPAGGGWGLCMSAKVTDPAKVEAIGKLMKYISDSDFGESLLYAGVYPSSMPVSFDESKLPTLGVQYMAALKGTGAGLFWDLALPAVVIDKMETEVEMFLLGKTVAEDVAASIQKSFEDSL